jgi:uncharacterized protein (DUF1501 family)
MALRSEKMAKSTLSRRDFLVGCSAAIAALAGSRLTHLSFAGQSESGDFNEEILIVIFLRGGVDGLNVVPPIAGPDRGIYETKRPYLNIPVTGPDAALALNSQFGFHPAMAPAYNLYQAGKLAVVQAAGLTNDTRSHFDAMQYMELGTPGVKTTTTGWITRHLQSAPNLPASILLPALSVGSAQSVSLIGSNEAVAMTDPDGFTFNGHWNYRDAQRLALRNMFAGDHWLSEAGTRTLNLVDLIEAADPGAYIPANGAVYPDNSFGNSLQVVAQLIKLDMGLRIATIDLGGFDTHEYQGDGSGGYLADLLGTLAEGLEGLYTDLDGSGAQDYNSRTTCVVKSEFGRRLKENANHGTDHGHGNFMFVLGGNVNGGAVYGDWPGLADEALYEHADLAITTDFRRVLSEILIRRLANPYLNSIFPGYEGYSPLGVVQGTDLEPVSGSSVYLPITIK